MSPLIALVSVAVLADFAVKGLAIMLAAAGIALLLRRASAAWRHLAWTLSAVSVLLLPALSIGLPAWRVSWIPSWHDETTSAVATSPIQGSSTAVDRPLTDRPVDASLTVVVTADRAQVHSSDAAGVISPPTGGKEIEFRPSLGNWIAWIVPVWMIGVGLALVPLAVGMFQLFRLRQGSAIVTEPQWLSLVESISKQLGVRQRVRLARSAHATMPLTWGALWPVLLIPAEADTWSPDRRRLVLLHELAHVRRWDWLTQMAAHAACAVHWFNPLVWLAARQMRVERERACDDLVLASGAKASDYAEELLRLAAGLADPQLATLAAVPMAHRSVLEDRLRAILDSRQRRAAITTVAALLAAAIVAVAIIPLAMLRAEQPKPVQPPASATNKETQPSAQRSPTPEELEARSKGIRISVLNSAGDKGIAQFRIIAGTPAGSTSEEFEKRTGRKVFNWQPHTLRIGKDGDYVWPLDKAYDTMALRVEADGYEPQAFYDIKKADGVQHVVFQLKEDKGVAGLVLTPDGKPAAEARIALALAHKDAVLQNGKLRGDGEPPAEKPSDRWRLPLIVKSDDAGRFRLPTEFEPAAVLVVHESGVREMTYATFQKSPEIKLERWGKIDGHVLWRDKPGMDEEVTLSIHRDEYGYPGMIASYAETKTDKDGRFVFDKVLPGRAQISRPIRPAEPSKSGITAINLDGMITHAVVQAGDSTPVLIGGQGRKVVGKLVGLDSWKGVTFHFHPTAPHVGLPGDDAMWKAYGQLQASPIGPILFRDKQPVKDDGTFTIENMLPGNYQLFVTAPGFTSYAAYSKVEIEPEVPGLKPAAIDIGVITAKKPLDAVKPVAEAPMSKTVTIRGKVVDDETGKPIERLITQAGKFDPADPTKVTWGYSEGRSSASDGSFSTTVRWDEGWTARILADGYVPQPVLTSAPPADKTEIEVTIRLKRGRTMVVEVIDHLGKPVKDARGFAIGPTGLNLAGGKAWTGWGEVNDEARGAPVDEFGRCIVAIGDAKAVAVSAPSFDAWPAAIPAEGKLAIKLPEPARVDIEVNIDGADKDSKVFYQLLSHLMPEFAGLQSSRELPIANGGKLSLPALPPGKYQICRQLMHRLGDFGTSAMLDREFFEVKAGETKAIRWVRDKGARVRGKIGLPMDTPLAGVIVSVRAEKAEKSPFDMHEWQTTYSSQVATPDGSYLTERIAPGTYLLVAQGFTPLSPEARFSTGVIGPAFRAEMKIEVPAEGELAVADLELKASQRRD